MIFSTAMLSGDAIESVLAFFIMLGTMVLLATVGPGGW